MSGILSSVAGLGSDATALGATIGSVLDGSWLTELLPATWRGVPFQIRDGRHRFGRQVAVHEYPFRDDVWPEDMGRAQRLYDFSGFVVGDDCHAQARALIAACEAPGPGTLNHPWLGSRQVSLVDMGELVERWEEGRTLQVRLLFVEASKPIYPSAADDTGAASLGAGLAAMLAGAANFAGRIGAFIGYGATVIQAGVNLVGRFAAETQNLVRDASLLANAVAGLPPPAGMFYGRYANPGALYPGAPTTMDGAIAAITQARAAVAQAGADAVLAAGTMGADANPLPSAVLVLTEAVRTCCRDPADAVRLLSALAGFQAPTSLSVASTGLAIDGVRQAVAALCRQAALVSLGRACAASTPASARDAIVLRDATVTLLDAEILRTADLGQGGVYMALRSLRTAVVADLNTRAAQLPNLITITTAAPEPALALAYRLYGDASRADELTTRSGAVASMFLPTSFQGLSR